MIRLFALVVGLVAGAAHGRPLDLDAITGQPGT